MVNQYGAGGTITAEMDGPFSSFGSMVKLSTVTLLADGWKNAESPYFQTVVLDGVSINSMVDLIANTSQIESLFHSGTALTAFNDSGTVTVYAVGNKPTVDLTLEVSITEVVK